MKRILSICLAVIASFAGAAVALAAGGEDDLRVAHT